MSKAVLVVLHMTTEFEEYKRLFPDTHWMPRAEQQNLAQVVVIGYNGRALTRTTRFSTFLSV